MAAEKCSIESVSRSPITMSASPRRIGSTRRATSRADVLVVGVGVHDDVGAELEAGVETGLEGGGQPLVVGQAHHVVDAVAACHLDRVVARPVVDHEPLDAVDPGQLTREVRERRREVLRLVEAGDLDDQLHRAPPKGRETGRRARLYRALHNPRPRSPNLPANGPGAHSLRDAGRPVAAAPVGAQLRPVGVDRVGPRDLRARARHDGRPFLEARPGAPHHPVRAARRRRGARALARGRPGRAACSRSCSRSGSGSGWAAARPREWWPPWPWPRCRSGCATWRTATRRRSRSR